VKILNDEGWDILVRREPPDGNQIFILFEKYPLPAGWNKKETRLLLITDVSYPNSKLDMFWVEPGLKLEGGGTAQAGDAIENHLGQQWQRFSWHVQKWNPAVDNVITYLGTVNARLRQLQ
jgi:hypothetical protein